MIGSCIWFYQEDGILQENELNFLVFVVGIFSKKAQKIHTTGLVVKLKASKLFNACKITEETNIKLELNSIRIFVQIICFGIVCTSYRLHCYLSTSAVFVSFHG